MSPHQATHLQILFGDLFNVFLYVYFIINERILCWP